MRFIIRTVIKLASCSHYTSNVICVREKCQFKSYLNAKNTRGEGLKTFKKFYVVLYLKSCRLQHDGCILTKMIRYVYLGIQIMPLVVMSLRAPWTEFAGFAL